MIIQQVKYIHNQNINLIWYENYIHNNKIVSTKWYTRFIEINIPMEEFLFSQNCPLLKEKQNWLIKLKLN